MTENSRALNSGDYNSNFLLLELPSAPECSSFNVTNSECSEYRFGETIPKEFKNICISEYEIVKFTTEDQSLVFISNIEKNMVVYVITVGEK